MRTILSIILILASIGGFVAFVLPTYNEAKTIKAQKESYEEVLNNASILTKKRDELIARYSEIQQSDIDRLERMLPSNPDNVKLILEIDGIAKKNGLTLQNVKINQSEDQKNGRPEKSGNQDLGTLSLEFSTSGPYTGYVNFITALEKNLRIMNIKKVTFIAPDDKASYQYQTSVETYWVK